MTTKEFETSYRKLYLPLGMFALRLVADADIAEDLVQDAFMKTWEYVGAGGEIDSFTAFMYRSVRNTCMDYLRGRHETLGEESIPDVGEEVIDTSFRDEYYLTPPDGMWNSPLCSGTGTAKGMDLKIEKRSGKITGHIAYSLAWTDRTFAEKNGGKTFPARFDNRHTINILLNWNISRKVQLNAAWTGHSGNRFTFMP